MELFICLIVFMREVGNHIGDNHIMCLFLMNSEFHVWVHTLKL